MKVLALDTALGACSVAAIDGGSTRCLAYRHELMRTGQAERLMPMVADVLAEAGLCIADFDRLATTIGPGSFTGIRTALAAARGFALASGKPLIGVVTLEALMLGAKPRSGGRPIAAAIDARKGEVYFQRFDADGTACDAPALLAIAEAATRLQGADWALVGSGAPLLASAHAEAIGAAPDPDARLVGEIACHRQPDIAMPAPLYIRPPDALLPSKPAWR